MIAQALVDVAEALDAAGVPAAVDPRDVNLPGAWVQHVSHDADLLGGRCVTALFRVLLITPDVGTFRALQMLDDLEDQARLVIALNATQSVTDRTVQLPDSATYYPARVLETLVQITPDEETP